MLFFLFLLMYTVYNIFFSFALLFISTAVIDMLCQLFVRVSDQHESLCYFGH